MELKGIDYFPFSINFFEDNKIALLEAEFGSDGVVVILKLLSRIYRGGYYCHWEDDDCLLFARKAMDGMAAETVRAIVAKAVERRVKNTLSLRSTVASAGGSNGWFGKRNSSPTRIGGLPPSGRPGKVSALTTCSPAR